MANSFKAFVKAVLWTFVGMAVMALSGRWLYGEWVSFVDIAAVWAWSYVFWGTYEDLRSADNDKSE